MNAIHDTDHKKSIALIAYLSSEFQWPSPIHDDYIKALFKRVDSIMKQFVIQTKGIGITSGDRALLTEDRLAMSTRLNDFLALYCEYYELHTCRLHPTETWVSYDSATLTLGLEQLTTQYTAEAFEAIESKYNVTLAPGVESQLYQLNSDIRRSWKIYIDNVQYAPTDVCYKGIVELRNNDTQTCVNLIDLQFNPYLIAILQATMPQGAEGYNAYHPFSNIIALLDKNNIKQNRYDQSFSLNLMKDQRNQAVLECNFCYYSYMNDNGDPVVSSESQQPLFEACYKIMIERDNILYVTEWVVGQPEPFKASLLFEYRDHTRDKIFEKVLNTEIAPRLFQPAVSPPIPYSCESI